ncbi:MAG: hypothetical protein AABY07_02630, partial [Nanoarchaeota archaeon]
VLVHRGPKIFQAIRWVKPHEEEHIEEEDTRNEEWADIEIYGEKLAELKPDDLWYVLSSARGWHDYKGSDFEDEDTREKSIEYYLDHKFGSDILDNIKKLEEQFNVQIKIEPPSRYDPDWDDRENFGWDINIRTDSKNKWQHDNLLASIDPSGDVHIYDGSEFSWGEEAKIDIKEHQQRLFDSLEQLVTNILGEPEYSKWKSNIGYFPSFIDAKQGKKSELITIYRDMSQKEYDMWEKGEEIPAGKYFATSKDYAKGADINYSSDSQVYRFKISSDLLVPDGSGGWQLDSNAKLNIERNTIEGHNNGRT